MLGTAIFDPLGQDGEAGTHEGLGLLPVATTIEPHKRTARTRARVVANEGPLACLSELLVSGYEVHMGATTLAGSTPLLALEADGPDPSFDGCVAGNVCGCYLHGLFDAAGVADALAQGLLKAKGIEGTPAGAPSAWELQEAELDRLAAALRQSLNMDLLFQIIEEGLT